MTRRIESPLVTAKQYLGFDRFESDDIAPFESPNTGSQAQKTEVGSSEWSHGKAAAVSVWKAEWTERQGRSIGSRRCSQRG